jgi:hypothetical protein
MWNVDYSACWESAGPSQDGECSSCLGWPDACIFTWYVERVLQHVSLPESRRSVALLKRWSVRVAWRKKSVWGLWALRCISFESLGAGQRWPSNIILPVQAVFKLKASNMSTCVGVFVHSLLSHVLKPVSFAPVRSRQPYGGSICISINTCLLIMT